MPRRGRDRLVTLRKRLDESPTRQAHADADLLVQVTHQTGPEAFDPIQLDVPKFDMDTSGAYRPGLHEIVALVNAGR